MYCIWNWFKFIEDTTGSIQIDKYVHEQKDRRIDWFQYIPHDYYMNVYKKHS